MAVAAPKWRKGPFQKAALESCSGGGARFSAPLREALGFVKGLRHGWRTPRASHAVGGYSIGVVAIGGRDRAGCGGPRVSCKIWVHCLRRFGSFSGCDSQLRAVRDFGRLFGAALFLCAEHVYQLGGGSPLHNVMDVK
jgi:hypothetical protein